MRTYTYNIQGYQTDEPSYYKRKRFTPDRHDIKCAISAEQAAYDFFKDNRDMRRAVLNRHDRKRLTSFTRIGNTNEVTRQF